MSDKATGNTRAMEYSGLGGCPMLADVEATDVQQRSSRQGVSIAK